MNPEDNRTVCVGAKLPVLKRMDGLDDYYKAEVLAIKESFIDFSASTTTNDDKKFLYYVHYCDFNKRLDEWVDASRFKLEDLERPPSNVSVAITPSANGALGNTSKNKTPKKLSGAAAAGVSKKAAAAVIKSQKNIKTITTQSPLSQEVTNHEVMQQVSAPSPKRTSQLNIGDGRLRQTPERFAPPSSERSTPAGELSENTGSEHGSSMVDLLTNPMEALRRGGSMTMRPEEQQRVKNVMTIELGKHRVDAWYFSPYPESLLTGAVLHICEPCLEAFPDDYALMRHRPKCVVTVPPGKEIYRQNLLNAKSGDIATLSFFEIDGHKQKAWCRNLCLLSKLFLDHKTLYYDVDPFLFYVLIAFDSHGGHLVGYYSKEKDSIDNYNVACILTLPQHQRKGYGKLLIAMSYELSKRQGKPGSPEKPLSDLGLLSYRSYWFDEIVKVIVASPHSTEISVQEISAKTCITCDDILHTLQAMDALKYYKGQHVILLSNKTLADYEKSCNKQRLVFQPEALQWTPPVFTANQLKYI